MEALLNALFVFLELVSSTQDVRKQRNDGEKVKNWVRNESCGSL